MSPCPAAPSRLQPRPIPAVLAATLLLAAGPAPADEGMWAFEHPPIAQIRERHGVTLTPAWLDALRAASVNYGASGSFVSDRGLLMTNHHVALSCIANVSSRGRDLARDGFLARRPADEIRCPGDAARVLVSTEDVTDAITQATAGARNDEERNSRRKIAIAEQESRCKQSSGLRCEVVAMYSGALFQLYRFQEWEDVRLVFAPEYQAAFFGGDPDNFVFPRFALDVALFRVYDKAGQPVRPAHHLRLASQPLKDGDLVFSAGHPHQTERLMTLAQLNELRDVELPLHVASAENMQALLQAYSRRSPEAARQALDSLFGTENWLKSQRGQLDALRDPVVMARKADDEARFRAAYAKLSAPAGSAAAAMTDPWQQIDAATQRHRSRAAELWTVGYGYRTLFATAGQLVEQAYERQLPEGERLPDYRDAAMNGMERELKAELPVYKDLEVVRLTGVLADAKRLLAADHPYLRATLGSDTPEAAAERLIRSSSVDQAAERTRLLAGGVAAIEASTDPLIRAARAVYPLRRALQRFNEEQVQSPIERAAQALGQARFAIDGFKVPPDATGTLRLSYGVVRGYQSHGWTMPWKSTWGGWLARADSFDQRPPFNLPARIEKSRRQVDPRTPLNLVSTLDIIGGSSGSPVVNQRGEWVGLVFDSNLEALGGAFVYTDERARALSVHADAIVTALDQVYGAPALARELRGGR